MKRISQNISNIGFIYTLSVVIAIVMHLLDGSKTVNVRSLITLFIIVSATQVVSEIMEYISINSEAVHMLVELMAMEILVFVMGYLFRLFNFQKPYYILINALLIGFVYAMTIIYYSISTKITADKINKYLEREKERENLSYK